MATSWQKPADQLGAVVRHDHAGPAVTSDDLIELAHHAGAGERGVDNRHQALAGEVIDDVQPPEAAAMVQSIRHEVEAPALGRFLRDGRRRHRGTWQMRLFTASHLDGDQVGRCGAANLLGALN